MNISIIYELALEILNIVRARDLGCKYMKQKKHKMLSRFNISIYFFVFYNILDLYDIRYYFFLIHRCKHN